MRRILIVATTLAALLVPAAAASADGAAELTFLSKRGSAWSGWQLALARDNVKNVKAFAVVFPAGTRIDLSRAEQCTASRDERVNRGHREVCPEDTLIGAGVAEATSTSGDSVKPDLELWNVLSDRGPTINIEQYAGETRFTPFSGFVQGTRQIRWDLAAALPVTAVGVRVPAKIVKTPRCGVSRRWTLKTVITLDDDTTETYSHRQRCRR